MSVSGFDWQRLNRVALSSLQQPLNQAADYGINVIKAPAGPAWRCIGVFKLAPQENKSRRNVFLDVLDELGNRTRQPVINWTWYMDAPTQTVRLDKPDNEPAGDIPVEKSYTVTLRVNGDGLPSDSVGGIHTRHADEGEGNSWGHHSFYVVFQRQQGNIIAPPIDPVGPPPSGDVAALRAENLALRNLVARYRQVVTGVIGELGAIE
jgi:hypothetical protein